MTSETYDYIYELLREHEAKVYSSLLHLNHQKETTPRFRVIELTEDELNEQITLLSQEASRIAKSINQFQALKPSDEPQWGEG